MIIGFEDFQIDQWKKDLHNYESFKKNSSQPEEQLPQFERVHQQQPKILNRDNVRILASENKLIRARIEAEQMKASASVHKHHSNQRKYDKDYDIITLHPMGLTPQLNSNPNSSNKAPIRSLFNLINNQKLPELYWKGRNVILPLQHQKKFANLRRDFNIISGDYRENNQERREAEVQQKSQQILEKYTKIHHFNKILGQCYNPMEEEQLKKKQKQDLEEQYKHFNERFPPSYQAREPVIVDSNQLNTEKLMELDERRKNAKKRFQMKYLMDEQYKQKNIQHQDRAEQMALNKYLNYSKREDHKKYQTEINQERKLATNNSFQEFQPLQSSLIKNNLKTQNQKSLESMNWRKNLIKSKGFHI